jgi:nucleoside-diphosphate-sugar epimerase
MKKIAVIGASGFVGTRMVERWVLGGKYTVVPVVRSPASLAVLARFELPWQICNIFNPDALAKALAGCDGVVHSAIGDPRQIPLMAEAIYRGAEKAGIRRLVVLSSASVHGQAPTAGTNEDSPLHENHSMAYNNAKVRAEKVLNRLRANGNVEVVQLRPSVVYGPRSRWIADTAKQLLNGTTGLVNDGDAICNGIYVDNLIQAVELALEVPKAADETFLVGDAETVTWREFYQRIADGEGVSMDSVRSIAPPSFPRSLKSRVADWAAVPGVQKIMPLVPGRAKRLTKLMLANWHEPAPGNAWQMPGRPAVMMTEELALLQQCHWTLSSQKTKTLLGYEPEVTFDEAMQRSIAWLRFTGLHVKS